MNNQFHPFGVKLLNLWNARSQCKRVNQKEKRRLYEKLLWLTVTFRACFILLHGMFFWGLFDLIKQLKQFFSASFQSSLTYIFVSPLLILWIFSLIWVGKLIVSFYGQMGITLRIPLGLNEFLLHLLLPRENREAVIGDLAEEADAIREKFGPRHAQFFWWCEVLKSFGPLLWRVVQKLLGFGVLDWIRRHI